MHRYERQQQKSAYDSKWHKLCHSTTSHHLFFMLTQSISNSEFPPQQYENTVWPETTTIHWIFSSSDFYVQLCQKKKKKNMWRHHGQDFLRQLLLVCGHAKLAFLQICCKLGFKKKMPGQPTKHFRRFRCSLQFFRALTPLKKKKQSTPNKQHSMLHLTPLHTVLLLYIHIHMCVFTYQWQVAHPW